MKQPLASLLLALAIALPAHAQLLTPTASASQPLDRIVAVVNDDVILQSELNEAVVSVQQQYAGHTEQLPPMNVLQQQVLNRLVLMRLQIQKAQDQGIHVSDADVDQAVQGVAQQNKLTPEQLQRRSRAQRLQLRRVPPAARRPDHRAAPAPERGAGLGLGHRQRNRQPAQQSDLQGR